MGSEKPWHQMSSPRRMRGRKRAFCSAVPHAISVGPTRPRATARLMLSGASAAAHSSLKMQLLDQRRAAPAVLARPGDAGPAAVVQRRLPGLRRGDLLVRRCAARGTPACPSRPAGWPAARPAPRRETPLRRRRAGSPCGRAGAGRQAVGGSASAAMHGRSSLHRASCDPATCLRLRREATCCCRPWRWRSAAAAATPWRG